MYSTDVYFQVSSRHRIVAKFPEGLTGKQALLEKSLENGRRHRDVHVWIEGLGEGHSGDLFLRENHQNERLSRLVWANFKERGGTTYLQYSYEKRTFVSRLLDFRLGYGQEGLEKVMEEFDIDCVLSGEKQLTREDQVKVQRRMKEYNASRS